MKLSRTKLELDAELSESAFKSAEVDNLISSAEARIEQQRKHVHDVASDFEASMKAIADLETMTTALEKLLRYRMRMAGEEKEPTS